MALITFNEIVTNHGREIINDPNGGYWLRGYITEEVILSTGGATSTTASTGFLPANSIIEAVVARVTKSIGTATNWQLGDSVTAGRFSAASTLLSSGDTVVGTLHIDNTSAAGSRQPTAAALRITLTGTPTTGRIRVTSFYRQFVPPTA